MTVIWNFIEEIKSEIQKQRVSVVVNANASMICLYWNIGRAILARQDEEGWGTKGRKMHSRKCPVFLLETSSICVNLPNVGQIMKLCNGSLHKYRGVQI